MRQRRDQILADTLQLLQRSGAANISVRRGKHHVIRFKHLHRRALRATLLRLAATMVAVIMVTTLTRTARSWP